jgi:hypothetical protein
VLALLATVAFADPVLVDLSGYPGTWLLDGQPHQGRQVLDLEPGHYQLGLLVGVGVDVAPDGTVTVTGSTGPASIVTSDGRTVAVSPNAQLARSELSALSCTPVALPLPMPEAPPEPKQPPAPIARLSVFMTGLGWADVFVDGERLSRTAPLRDYPLAPGSHEIRVRNEQAGIDAHEVRDFAAGETVILRASVP